MSNPVAPPMTFSYAYIIFQIPDSRMAPKHMIQGSMVLSLVRHILSGIRAKSMLCAARSNSGMLICESFWISRI